jgi:hypothetical protein
VQPDHLGNCDGTAAVLPAGADSIGLGMQRADRDAA